MKEVLRSSGGLRFSGNAKTSTETKPLISIVTVVYNGSCCLETAIKSVLNQTYANIEYILIDGSSNDGTLDIIKKYNDRIDLWISEPDKGMYDAMNKGIGLTTGDIIGLLNSDDFYFPRAIETLVRYLKEEGSCIWYGKQMRFEEHYDFCNFRIQSPDIGKMYERPSIFHPACFVHRNVYQTIGLFDLKYKIISDYDFLLRAIERGISFNYIDTVFTGFRSGGISGSARAWIESYRLTKEHPRHKATKFYITRSLLKKAFILGLLKNKQIQGFFSNKRKRNKVKNAKANSLY